MMCRTHIRVFLVIERETLHFCNYQLKLYGAKWNFLIDHLSVSFNKPFLLGSNHNKKVPVSVES